MSSQYRALVPPSLGSTVSASTKYAEAASESPTASSCAPWSHSQFLSSAATCGCPLRERMDSGGPEAEDPLIVGGLGPPWQALGPSNSCFTDLTPAKPHRLDVAHFAALDRGRSAWELAGTRRPTTLPVRGGQHQPHPAWMMTNTSASMAAPDSGRSVVNDGNGTQPTIAGVRKPSTPAC